MQGFFHFFFVGATIFFVFSRKYSNNRKLRRACFSENCYKEIIFLLWRGLFVFLSTNVEIIRINCHQGNLAWRSFNLPSHFAQ